MKILFFAGLREQLGTSGEEIELPAGVTTVGALRTHLLERGNSWQEALAENKLIRTALNQDMVDAGAKLKAGDEVAFFPPVTGG